MRTMQARGAWWTALKEGVGVWTDTPFIQLGESLTTPAGWKCVTFLSYDSDRQALVRLSTGEVVVVMGYNLFPDVRTGISERY